MKKLFISFALLCAVVSMNAQKNVIKTNPFGLALGNFNLTYEKVLNTSSSVLFKGQYMFKLLGLDVNLGGIGAGYRYYITNAKKQVPTGFYINPQTSLSFGSVSESGTSYSATSFGIGAEIGYQWVWDSGFTLDLGIGPNYNVVSSEGVSGNGIVPSATLAIGYAF